MHSAAWVTSRDPACLKIARPSAKRLALKERLIVVKNDCQPVAQGVGIQVSHVAQYLDDETWWWTMSRRRVFQERCYHSHTLVLVLG